MRRALPALALLGLAWPTVVAAQDVVMQQDTGASPQDWATELKFGPYRPHVDDEFNGSAHPYQDLFGTANHFLIQGEVDYELWHRYGTLAAGAQIGFVTQSAQALAICPAGSTTCTPGQPYMMNGQWVRSPADTTSFSIIPMAALAVYRFDVPWERWSVPLTPYAKLGFVYDVWWVTAGDGSVPSTRGSHGYGATTGWQGTLGIGFLLDWADPEAAKDLDIDLGINHTYIDLEYVHASVNDFGGSHALNVGDDTWNIGFAFEF